VAQIAYILDAPRGNVEQNWPVIWQALQEFGLTDRATVIAALATIRVECPPFKPIPEWASGDEYEGRLDLGNTQPGDGRRFKGRGFLQLTGRSNYRQYGERVGVDLEGDPDLALDPNVSAKILALYFVDRDIPESARLGTGEGWRQVRRKVNGGFNGWDTFYGYVHALEAL
jgi:hypothetical protein